MSRTLLRTPNLDLSQKANNKSQSVFSQYYDAIDASNWWRALMPNKYPQKKGWNIPKQKYKLTNWPEYNESLKRRGSIDV